MGTYGLIVGQRIFIVQNAKVLVLMSQALVETMRGADHPVVAETILEVEMLHVDVTDKGLTAETEKTVEDRLLDGETDLTAEDDPTVGMTSTELVLLNTRKLSDMKLSTGLQQKAWMLIMSKRLQMTEKMMMDSLRDISMKIVIR